MILRQLLCFLELLWIYKHNIPHRNCCKVNNLKVFGILQIQSKISRGFFERKSIKAGLQAQKYTLVEILPLSRLSNIHCADDSKKCPSSSSLSWAPAMANCLFQLPAGKHCRPASAQLSQSRDSPEAVPFPLGGHVLLQITTFRKFHFPDTTT